MGIVDLACVATWMSDPFVRLSRSDLQSIQEAALTLSEASARLASEITDVLCGGYWTCEPLVAPAGWPMSILWIKLMLEGKRE